MLDLFIMLKVTCGNRCISLRTKNSSKAKDWVAAINDAGLRPPEGWCHPHRFESFAPLRGLIDDGSMAQWFVDGQAAFEAISLAIENAKSEVCSITHLFYTLLVLLISYLIIDHLCRFLFVAGGFAQSYISDALLRIMLHQGLMLYLNQKPRKESRYPRLRRNYCFLMVRLDKKIM